MKTKFILIGCLLLGLSVLTSCSKESIYKGDEEKEKPVKDSFFDFATDQEVEININYQVPAGFVVNFEVYAENPLSVNEFGSFVKKENVTCFLSGHTDENGHFSMAVTLPSYASEIYVYSPMVGVPVLMAGKVENAMVTPVEVSPVAKSKALPTRASAVYWKNWEKQQLKWSLMANYDEQGKPLETVQMDVDGELLKAINGTLNGNNSNWVITHQLDVLTVEKAGKVNLYSIKNETSTRNNVLAYYLFKDDELVLPSLLDPNYSQLSEKYQKEINENRLIMAFPNLGGKSGLSSGEGIQLKYWDGEKFLEEFPAGTKIGFVLLVDAWKNGQVENNTHALYSDRNYNSYSIPSEQIFMAQRIHMASFKAQGKVVIAFEDQPSNANINSKYKPDYADNIFIVDIEDSNVEEGPGPEEPGDILVNNTGTLLFEDEWPFKGDYDMNDVVISYNGKASCKVAGNVYKCEDTFVVENNGAQYHNAFGLMVGGTLNKNVESIEVVSDWVCEGQGWTNRNEAAANPVVMLFDDIQKVPIGTKFTLKISYALGSTGNGVLYNKQTAAPYNPFIVIRQKDTDPGYLSDKRKELHLVNYKPTSKADAGLFGTGDDLSDVSKNIYYVSDANYPFAIDLRGVEEFKLPAEKSNISKLYPKFDLWYSTNGEEYKDWYLSPAQ